MKLDELSLKGDGYSLSELIAGLQQKRGFSHDRGVNAFVINFPGKNYVYRVWMDGTDGYDEFVKYLQSHSSEHLVKLLSPVRTERTKDGVVKYVKIEKLTPLKMIYEHLINAVGECTEMHFSTFNDFKDEIQYKLDERESDLDLDQYDDLLATCYDLITAGANDIHSGNAMMRGNTVVMTDPFINAAASKVVSAAVLVFPDDDGQ